MKRRHCLIDRRLQTAEALFILLQPAELNTLYLSPQLSVRPVEVTVMTRSTLSIKNIPGIDHPVSAHVGV